MSKSSVSELEVVGVAAAAAAALGGMVAALSRAQANTDAAQSMRQRVTRIQNAGTQRAYPPIEHAYESAADVVARVQPRISARSQALRQALPGRKRGLRQRLPAPFRRPSAWERLARRTPSPPSTEQMQALASEAVAAIQPRLAAARPRADSAVRTVQKSWEDALQSDLVQSSGPALKAFGERFEDVRESAAEAIAEAPHRLAVRAEQVREALPEVVVVELPSPQPMVQRGKSAAKETFATLGWLVVASAVVYFFVLSEERREQLKSWACSGLEQAHLLALDFRGYEPDM